MKCEICAEDGRDTNLHDGACWMHGTALSEQRRILRTDQKPAPAVVASLPVQEEKPIRIWAAHCPFKKNGFPSLGTFGYTSRAVVILPMETWTRLCREIPELGRRQFEVGTQD